MWKKMINCVNVWLKEKVMFFEDIIMILCILLIFEKLRVGIFG